MNTVEQYGDNETFLAIVNGTITNYVDDQITTVGQGAFSYCTDLVNVDLPNVETINQYSFYASGLTSITLPKLTRLSNSAGAFTACRNLVAVSFPIATGELSSSMFSSCGELTSVSIPNADRIGSSAFTSCSKLQSADFPSVTYIGYYAFEYDHALQTINFPLATVVNRQAFMNCIGLTRVVLPSVVTLQEESFRGCTALTFVSLPSVNELRRYDYVTETTQTHYEYPFYGCTALTDIYVPFAETDAAATGAPWGAENATVHYSTQFDENGEPII